MGAEPLIQIKGIRDGLLISAVRGSWDDRKNEILQLVKEKKGFFKGARACLEVGDTLLRVKEITQLRDRLCDLDVTLWAILSESEITENNARTLGLDTSLPAKKVSKQEEEHEEDAGEKAVWVHKTLRAGYRVESQDHVIVLGDVNPGAEIVTAGSVIVWGKLKGSVIAGEKNNLNSVVCALELRPTQLRIGGQNFPPFQKKGGAFPEKAFIENDECRIEIWKREKG